VPSFVITHEHLSWFLFIVVNVNYLEARPIQFMISLEGGRLPPPTHTHCSDENEEEVIPGAPQVAGTEARMLDLIFFQELTTHAGCLPGRSSASSLARVWFIVGAGRESPSQCLGSLDRE
jgi:hypothetical protein